MASNAAATDGAVLPEVHVPLERGMGAPQCASSASTKRTAPSRRVASVALARALYQRTVSVHRVRLLAADRPARRDVLGERARRRRMRAVRHTTGRRSAPLDTECRRGRRRSRPPAAASRTPQPRGLGRSARVHGGPRRRAGTRVMPWSALASCDVRTDSTESRIPPYRTTGTPDPPSSSKYTDVPSIAFCAQTARSERTPYRGRARRVPAARPAPHRRTAATPPSPTRRTRES